jgi:hypothetical protein
MESGQIIDSGIKNLKIRENAQFKVERWIEVKFTREGIHRYPAAEKDTNLATGDYLDVSFLAYPHRHIFHFYVSIAVTHNDREIEFIQFKRWLEKEYSSGTMNVDYKSCEMLAEDLFNLLQQYNRFKNRDLVVKVYEDDENGAILKFKKV